MTIEKKRLHYIYRHCLWVREEQIHWSPLYIYQKYLKLFIWRFKKPFVHSPCLKFMFWNRGVFVLLAWPLVIGQVQMFTNTLVDCPDLILAFDGVHKLGDIQSLKKDLFISNWKEISVLGHGDYVIYPPRDPRTQIIWTGSLSSFLCSLCDSSSSLSI